MMSINTTSHSCGALAAMLDGRLTILSMRHDGTGTAERKLRDLGVQIVILYEQNAQALERIAMAASTRTA